MVLRYLSDFCSQDKRGQTRSKPGFTLTRAGFVRPIWCNTAVKNVGETVVRSVLSSLAFISLLAACQAPLSEPTAYRGPIIDMHLHAFPADSNGPPGQSVCPGVAADLRFDPGTSWPQKFTDRMFEGDCEAPILGAMTDEQVRDQTIEALRRHNARGVLSGPSEKREEWMAAAPDLFF